MDKVNLNKVDVDGLGTRMARWNKNERAAATSEATKPRQPIKGILKKPKQGVTVSSGENQNDNQVMAASGSIQHALEADQMMNSSKVHTEEGFWAAHVTSLDSAPNTTRHGELNSCSTMNPSSTYITSTNMSSSSENSTTSHGKLNSGSMMNPSSTFVTSTYMSSSSTNSTTSTSCDPNLPKGDGISVSMKAGRFHVSNVPTSDIHDPHATSTTKVNQTGPSPMVQSVDVNSSSKSYAGVTSGVQNDNTKGKSNFRTLKADNVFTGVDVSIPRKVVQSVSAEFEHTLYGYVIGKRIAFPVVEYFVRNNWAKYGLKRVMMNANGFFFFKFDTQVGLDAVLEGGPWMIKNSPIILKKWTMSTSLTKEELTRIPV